jgi:hypothetical protein
MYASSSITVMTHPIPSPLPTYLLPAPVSRELAGEDGGAVLGLVVLGALLEDLHVAVLGGREERGEERREEERRRVTIQGRQGGRGGAAHHIIA